MSDCVHMDRMEARIAEIREKMAVCERLGVSTEDYEREINYIRRQQRMQQDLGFFSSPNEEDSNDDYFAHNNKGEELSSNGGELIEDDIFSTENGLELDENMQIFLLQQEAERVENEKRRKEDEESKRKLDEQKDRERRKEKERLAEFADLDENMQIFMLQQEAEREEEEKAKRKSKEEEELRQRIEDEELATSLYFESLNALSMEDDQRVQQEIDLFHKINGAPITPPPPPNRHSGSPSRNHYEDSNRRRNRDYTGGSRDDTYDSIGGIDIRSRARFGSGGGGGGGGGGGNVGPYNHFKRHSLSTKPKQFRVDLSKRNPGKQSQLYKSTSGTLPPTTGNNHHPFDNDHQPRETGPSFLPPSRMINKKTTLQPSSSLPPPRPRQRLPTTTTSASPKQSQTSHAGREAAFAAADENMKLYLSQEKEREEEEVKRQKEEEDRKKKEAENARDLKYQQDIEYHESLAADMQRKKDQQHSKCSSIKSSGGAAAEEEAIDTPVFEVDDAKTSGAQQLGQFGYDNKPEEESATATTHDSQTMENNLLMIAVTEYSLPSEPPVSHTKKPEVEGEPLECCSIKVRCGPHTKTRRFNFRTNTLADVAVFILRSSLLQSSTLADTSGGGGGGGSQVSFTPMPSFRVSFGSPSVTLFSNEDLERASRSGSMYAIMNHHVLRQSLMSVGITQNTLLILEIETA